MTRIAWALALALAVLPTMGPPLFAQARPYNVIMKDVGATVGAIRKNLDAGTIAPVAADAEKVQRLFQEVEAFWAPFKTKDALDAARGARETAVVIATAAKANDRTKATEGAAGLGRYCAACHDSHRELAPDKSYRIRP